jgi:hypothetical protein
MIEFLATIEVLNIIEEDQVSHGKKRGLGITLFNEGCHGTPARCDVHLYASRFICK